MLAPLYHPSRPLATALAAGLPKGGEYDTLRRQKMREKGSFVMHYLLLGGAIALEIFATTQLKLSEGFTKLGPLRVELCWGTASAFSSSPRR